MGETMNRRMAQLERRLERLLPESPVRFELWSDVEGGLVECQRTGERLTRERFAVEHAGAFTITLDLSSAGEDAGWQPADDRSQGVRSDLSLVARDEVEDAAADPGWPQRATLQDYQRRAVQDGR
jgi:hypothetical protein